MHSIYIYVDMDMLSHAQCCPHTLYTLQYCTQPYSYTTHLKQVLAQGSDSSQIQPHNSAVPWRRMSIQFQSQNFQHILRISTARVTFSFKFYNQLLV